MHYNALYRDKPECCTAAIKRRCRGSNQRKMNVKISNPSSWMIRKVDCCLFPFLPFLICVCVYIYICILMSNSWICSTNCLNTVDTNTRINLWTWHKIRWRLHDIRKLLNLKLVEMRSITFNAKFAWCCNTIYWMAWLHYCIEVLFLTSLMYPNGILGGKKDSKSTSLPENPRNQHVTINIMIEEESST